MANQAPKPRTHRAQLTIERITAMSRNHPKMQYFRLGRHEVEALGELLPMLREIEERNERRVSK